VLQPGLRRAWVLAEAALQGTHSFRSLLITQPDPAGPFETQTFCFGDRGWGPEAGVAALLVALYVGLGAGSKLRDAAQRSWLKWATKETVAADPALGRCRPRLWQGVVGRCALLATQRSTGGAPVEPLAGAVEVGGGWKRR